MRLSALLVTLVLSLVAAHSFTSALAQTSAGRAGDPGGEGGTLRGFPSNKISSTTTKININTASVKELMTLAGVGRRVAEKIVEHRQAHGPFKKADDVKRVAGVGAGVLEQNRGRIVVK